MLDSDKSARNIFDNKSAREILKIKVLGDIDEMKASYLYAWLNIWSMLEIDLQDQWIEKFKIG